MPGNVHVPWFRRPAPRLVFGRPALDAIAIGPSRFPFQLPRSHSLLPMKTGTGSHQLITHPRPLSLDTRYLKLSRLYFGKIAQCRMKLPYEFRSGQSAFLGIRDMPHFERRPRPNYARIQRLQRTPHKTRAKRVLDRSRAPWRPLQSSAPIFQNAGNPVVKYLTRKIV